MSTVLPTPLYSLRPSAVAKSGLGITIWDRSSEIRYFFSQDFLSQNAYFYSKGLEGAVAGRYTSGCVDLLNLINLDLLSGRHNLYFQSYLKNVLPLNICVLS